MADIVKFVYLIIVFLSIFIVVTDGKFNFAIYF